MGVQRPGNSLNVSAGSAPNPPMTTLNVVVEYVPAELEQPDHLSHIFTGWADFLRHVRESHRIVPSEDDGETWILHDALHVGEGRQTTPSWS